MIAAILENIADHISTKNPLFNNYFGGAVQIRGDIESENFHIVVIDNKGKMTEVGIDNRRGNYFYIRNQTGIDYDHGAEAQYTACDEASGTFEGRLVTYVKRGVQEKIINAISSDLMSYRNTTITGVINARVELTGVGVDFEQIYIDETGKPIPKAQPNVSLLAFDFNVNFVARSMKEGCLDREFCEPC